MTTPKTQKEAKKIKIETEVKYSVSIKGSFMEFMKLLAERNGSREAVYLYERMEAFTDNGWLSVNDWLNAGEEFLKTPAIINEEKIGDNIVIPHMRITIEREYNNTYSLEYMSHQGNKSLFIFNSPSYEEKVYLFLQKEGEILLKGNLSSLISKIHFLASIGNEEAKGVLESGFQFEDHECCYEETDYLILKRHILGYAKAELKKALKEALNK